jgi:UDPglucose 6-dehydrogenase
MNITIIGVGYVGLTNALYLSKHHYVFGYDVDYNRINELQRGQQFFHEEGFATLLKKNKTNYPLFTNLPKLYNNPKW